MPNNNAGDPLHGVTLKMMLQELLDHYGWEELGDRIRIQCFTNDPSISSSLKFLRRTPWARVKVEALFLEMKAEDDSPWP
jgi:uncharacterized protein (DUF2132 family)